MTLRGKWYTVQRSSALRTCWAALLAFSISVAGAAVARADDTTQAVSGPVATSGVSLSMMEDKVVPVGSHGSYVVLGRNKMSPQWSVGGSWMGLYIYYTQADQRIILAGLGGTLAAAICSATGGVACILGSGVIAGAFQAMSERGGICTGRTTRLRQLILYAAPSMPLYSCVK